MLTGHDIHPHNLILTMSCVAKTFSSSLCSPGANDWTWHLLFFNPMSLGETLKLLELWFLGLKSGAGNKTHLTACIKACQALCHMWLVT
jgi:hypothetical protein